MIQKNLFAICTYMITFFYSDSLRHTQQPIYTTNCKNNKGGRPVTEQLEVFEKTS